MADGSKIYTKGQEINKYNLTKDGKHFVTSVKIPEEELAEWTEV